MSTRGSRGSCLRLNAGLRAAANDLAAGKRGTAGVPARRRLCGVRPERLFIPERSNGRSRRESAVPDRAPGRLDWAGSELWPDGSLPALRSRSSSRATAQSPPHADAPLRVPKTVHRRIAAKFGWTRRMINAINFRGGRLYKTSRIWSWLRSRSAGCAWVFCRRHCGSLEDG